MCSLKYFLTILLIITATTGFSQWKVGGTVYDKSRINPVENVKVYSTSGHQAVTDSLGRYTILSNESDSLFFYYKGKPTQKFPVRSFRRMDAIDVSLAVTVEPKYTTLKEVIVKAKTYKEDSLQNRIEYSKYFDDDLGRAGTSIGQGGSVGLDLAVFNFKKNKQLRAFRERLLSQEQDKYVIYRFNKRMINTATGLSGEDIDVFMKHFTPSYRFVAAATEMQLIEYTIEAGKIFKQYRHLYQ